MDRLPAFILLSACWNAASASDIPPPRPVDVAALVRQLGSEDFSEREEASRRLSTLSVDAPPPELLAARNSPTPEIGDRARRAVKVLELHIVRERERAAIARLPRSERFAKRGQVDLYVASAAANKLKANDDRLWLPAFELGVRVGAKAAPEIGRLPLQEPPGPGWVTIKDFPTYRKSLLNDKFIRTNDMFIIEDKGYFHLTAGIMAAGVDSRKPTDGLIVSRGTVRVPGSVKDSLVLATGDVVVGGMIKSTIICDGDVQLSGVQWCLIIARGNVVVDGHSQENTILAGGRVTLKKSGGTVSPRQDTRDHVQSGVRRPLDFITFFELSTVGVEVKRKDRAVQVTSIIDDKPFADAGLRVGDIITEVNGKKPESAESLRRLLRDALAIGDATVQLQRGDKGVTVKVSLPE